MNTRTLAYNESTTLTLHGRRIYINAWILKSAKTIQEFGCFTETPELDDIISIQTRTPLAVPVPSTEGSLKVADEAGYFDVVRDNRKRPTFSSSKMSNQTKHSRHCPVVPYDSQTAQVKTDLISRLIAIRQQPNLTYVSMYGVYLCTCMVCLYVCMCMYVCYVCVCVCMVCIGFYTSRAVDGRTEVPHRETTYTFPAPRSILPGPRHTYKPQHISVKSFNLNILVRSQFF